MRIRPIVARTVSSLLLLPAVSLLPRPALAQQCAASCFDKRYELVVDSDGDGLASCGDVVRFDLTFCNGADPGGGPPLDCQITDVLNALNLPQDLVLIDDPANPGTPIVCTPDDAGQSSCVATPGGVTSVNLCQTDLSLNSVTVNVSMRKDACVTAHFWAILPSFPGANCYETDLCNQAIGGGAPSDDPLTPAPSDPTCFPRVLRSPVPPSLSKSIQGCPPPCALPVRPAPSVTTVRYELYLGRNPNLGAINVDIRDDVPPGAVGFRVIDKGNTSDCSTPGPPYCANVPAPGGANGTGEIVIYELDPGGGHRLIFEVDFACPPVTDGMVVSNQASFTVQGWPRSCPGKCLSDDPLTTAFGDPTVFTATCLGPSSIGLTKTRTDPNPDRWQTLDPVVVNYAIRLTNLTAAPVGGPLLDLVDYLPVEPIFLGPRFDPAASCPVAVTANPPQPLMTVDNSNCTAAASPSFSVSGLNTLAPGASVDLFFALTFPPNMSGLPAGTVIVNHANVGGPAGSDAEARFTIFRPPLVDFSTSTKTASADPVSTGAPIGYTVAVTNTGISTATNVVFTDPFPACLSTFAFDPVRDVTVIPGPPVVPPTFGGGRLTVRLGSLASNGTQTITIAGLQAGSTPTSACCNQAFLTADGTTLVQVTNDPTTPAPGDPTCVEIQAVSSGCDLFKSRITFPPVVPARVSPWVYTNSTGCTAPDSRVGTTVILTPAADDQDLDPIVASGTGGELTLYQMACPCLNGLKLVKNRASGNVHEYYCTAAGCQ